MDLGEVLTMHLGPEQVLLNIEVTFRPGITGGRGRRGHPPDRAAHPADPTRR